MNQANKQHGQQFIFICDSHYPDQPERRIEIRTNAVTLNELLEDFEAFLKGCGFVFDGQVDIAEDEHCLRDEDNLSTRKNLEDAIEQIFKEKKNL